MSSIDEVYEKDEEEIKEEFNEDEEIDKSADLEKEKQMQIMNEYNAEGNMAGMQVFIQNVGSLKMPYKQKTDDINLKVSTKTYNLCDVGECSEFVELYKNSEYLAIAVILSTFEVVALGDLPDLQKNLMQYLPLPKILDGEGIEDYYSQQDSYISLNKILAVIGGKRFVTEDGQACTGLGENSQQALANILEQFPLLRDPIVSWLIHMNEIYKYKTTFEAYQIVAAFSRVISLDIIDAERRIFQQLYSNPQNVGLLGSLVFKLYEDAALREEIENIILQWVRSDSIWLWKAACLAYSFFMENDICFSFEQLLYKAVSRRILRFRKDDWFFVPTLLIQSRHFRTMIANIFNSMYRKAESKEKKMALVYTYINLIRRSYYRVNASCMELPLVACDTKQQQQRISQIVTQIMSTYRLRIQLYIILETYLKEVSNYNFSVNMINHISAYFYNMASDDLAYQEDILHFLRNCNSRAANQIYRKLYSVYKRGELELHE